MSSNTSASASVRFLPRKSRKIRSVDTRQKEKQILDSVLGPKVYDRRIRPIGKPEPNMVNETGNNYKKKNNDKNGYDLFQESWKLFLIIQKTGFKIVTATLKKKHFFPREAQVF